MPAAKPMTSMNVSDIQRQMAQIRHDMHQEVQGAVKGAQSLTDWRSLVKGHPWLSISTASVIGYLIVPRRHPVSSTIVAVGNPSPELLGTTAARGQEKQSKDAGWSILGTAFSLVAPVAVRAAQNYAIGHFERWLSQHQMPPVPSEMPGGTTYASGQPNSTGSAARLRKYGA
jgi:hypothetical protein